MPNLILGLGLLLAAHLLQLSSPETAPGGGMPAQAVLTVSGVVVSLTQFAKWGGVPDRRGPLVVIGLSLLGTVFWAWSGGAVSRSTSFDVFAGFVAVMLSAAGVFGFTRAAPQAVSSFSPPPHSGAGNNPTS
jgi:hypothetical protein